MIEQHIKGVMDWVKGSVTVKLVFIAVLILVLLIPSSLVENLILERSNRQDEMVKDIADKWAGKQLIKGPVLVIPYHKTIKGYDENQKEIAKELIENLYILPDNLKIKAIISPETLHRGIFDAVVYNSSVAISGNFSRADLDGLGLTTQQLLLDKAKLVFSISDLKGLRNNPVLTAAGYQLTAQPIFNNKEVFDDGLQANINLTGVKDNTFNFDYKIALKGSQELHFLHLGKTTDVQASSTWASPSFDGRYLPDTRKVNEKGFDAKWRMLYYNRPFPQQWVADNTLLKNEKKQNDASFGVKLRLPVDQYQKITRTSKYAILIILLTFISLFLTEVIRKQRIHVFNYVLIGAAMIIYYSLLLSFAEQVGYNIAYAIASLSTVALIATFIASLLKNKVAAMLLAIILSGFYLFIFVIIQLEDLALMIGSIALFMIVGALMYFSRKINWDHH